MTYGTLVLEVAGRTRTVTISARPDVLTRLRRVLPRVAQTAGAIRVRATPEVCRDIRWVCERWPLEMDAATWSWLCAESADHQAQTEAFAGVLDGSVPARPLATALPLRSYQAAAVELAIRTRGLLVGDELGVGKTAIGIGLVAQLDARPAVVVTMTHLPRQWEAELQRFLPGVRTFIPRKASPYSLLERGTAHPFRFPANEAERERWPDVWILPYSKLRGWADTLRQFARAVIFDEAHELRAGHGATVSDKYVAARVLAEGCDYRLGLTGTPVFNYGADLWSIVNVLRSDSLGSLEEFRREWCAHEDRVRDPATFGVYLRSAGLYIRRTRADVGRELPALTVSTIPIDADPKPLREAQSVAAELARRILARTQDERGELFRAHGELDWRLRQATGIAKAPAVAAFVQLLVEQGEQVLLFGWHRAVYDLWVDAFQTAKIKFGLYTGEESTREKEEAVRAFVAGETQVLVMSLRSGAGLDGLQHSACSAVVHGELDWSPAVHKQGTGRVHRDGQEKRVTAYFPIAEIGSDPVIVDVLGVKRQQAIGVEDPTGSDLAPVADVDRVRQLARSYLVALGEKVEEPAVLPETEQAVNAANPTESVSDPSLVVAPQLAMPYAAGVEREA